MIFKKRSQQIHVPKSIPKSWCISKKQEFMFKSNRVGGDEWFMTVDLGSSWSKRQLPRSRIFGSDAGAIRGCMHVMQIEGPEKAKATGICCRIIRSRHLILLWFALHFCFFPISTLCFSLFPLQLWNSTSYPCYYSFCLLINMLLTLE